MTTPPPSTPPPSALPSLALSVRQPWAWAIIHGGKEIENRTAGAIRSGNMVPGRIAIHAATGLKEDEYAWGAWRLERHGVSCPRPDALVRGAIIGAVTVTAIVTQSASEWFGGPCGLVLADPEPCAPIPAGGALGYFAWQRSDAFAPTKPWMVRWNRPAGDERTGELFPDLAPSHAEPPPKPFGRRR